MNVTRGDASVNAAIKRGTTIDPNELRKPSRISLTAGLRQVLDRPSGRIELQLGPARVLVEDPAVGVERESSAAAIEQRDPQSPFQARQHPGECRLRDMKLFGRRRDMLQLRECDEPLVVAVGA